MKKMKRVLWVAVAALIGIATVSAQSNERGIDLYKAELYDAAKLFFLNQKNQSPELQAENYFYLGQTYYEMGQYNEASTYYKKAQEALANYPFGYVGEGRIALKNGDKKGAETLFKKAAGLAKKNPSVQTAIAEIYMDADMTKEGEVALEKAEKINRKYAGISVVRGNKYAREGDLGEAGRWYENAILFDPTDKEAYLKFARGYRDLNSTLALQKLDELLKVDPNYIPAYALIGDLNYKLGNYKTAIDAYEKFISIPGVPVEQEKNYAQLLYFTNQYEKSLNEIEKVLKKDPTDIIMLRLQGYNNYKLDNSSTAITLLNDFLSKARPEIHIYLDYITLSHAYLAENQNEEALVALEKAATFDNANMGEVYKDMATAYKNMKDYPKQMEYYEKYFASEGASPISLDYYMYGQAIYNYLKADKQYANADFDEAEFMSYINKGEAAYSEVIERSPDSHLGYQAKAELDALVDDRQYQLTGENQGYSIPAFEAAAQVMETKNADGSFDRYLTEIYRFIGAYYYGQKDSEKAGEYYKKILTIDPNNEPAQAALKALKIKY